MSVLTRFPYDASRIRRTPLPRVPPHKERTTTGAVAFIVTLVVATYAGTQLVLTHSVLLAAWWKTELAAQTAHVAHPLAPARVPLPRPPWQTWVPPAITATWLTASLIAFAMLVVAAGRGRWLFVVAALPLLPGRLADGSWAPAMPSFAVRVLVWPHGAQGSTLTIWAWWAAALSALAIAVPAMTYLALVTWRAPRLGGAELLLRLLPAALLVALVAAWNAAAGQPQDWGQLARRVLLATMAALVVTGGLKLRYTLPLIALLPALAAGWLTWQPSAGHSMPPVTIDATAWTGAAVALVGAAWALVQPSAARLWRGGVELWLDARATQADRARERLREREQSGSISDPGSSAGSSDDPSRREPERAFGRHRA